MKKGLFLIITVLAIFFIPNNVLAFTVKDYDSRLSLFDGFENSIPVCSNDTTVSEYGELWVNRSDTYRVCYKGTVPSIDTLITYMPYLMRFEYKLKNTNTNYYVWIFFNSAQYINDSNIIDFQGSEYFVISQLPEFITTDDGYVVLLDTAYKSISYSTYAEPISIYYDNSMFNSFGSNTSSWNEHRSFYFNMSGNPYFDITIKTNFNLMRENSSDVVIDATLGYEFETDVDITIPKDNYLLLVPKKNTEFSSYLWTDNNFAYSEMYYDDLTSSYSHINGGGFNEINFGSLGGFNWIRWDFNFTDLDLEFNKTIMIYNHGLDDNLHIKLFSSDFYYKLMSSSSSNFCVGDICYKNDYDDFKNYSYSTGPIKNQYDTGDYDAGMSFLKKIPDMISDFTKSFAFIGTLFTTAFVIFEGSIANYFFVIFGIMIIMLIIKILK